MKSIRQRLTLLINNIDENLPDEEDIYGYEGISKRIITQSLKESYDLLGNLDDYKDKFEVIFLQRSLADLIKESKENLKGGILKSAESKFDDFLNNVQKIRYLIRETYIAVTDHPIRVDIDLKKAKDQLSELASDIDDLSDLYEKLESIKKSSEGFLQKLEEKDEFYTEHVESINSSETEIKSAKEKIQIIAEQIAEWQEQIKTSSTSIANNKGNYEALVEDISSLKEEIQEAKSEFSEELDSLHEANSKNEEQQALIQKTIEDANRAGMAGSFKKRKDELRLPLIFWQYFTILTLGLLIYLSFVLIKPLISDPNWEEIIIKLPILASCVWLCWFSAKQYGFTTRIREDYAYKYAVSMAFEGYKNAAREINKDLLEQLLSLTVLNISKNPISIFETKNNHGSPINEIIDSTLKRINIIGTNGKSEIEKE
ncbi:coiled-coil domain-containing protein [Echinicola vietnamensis]|uniref:Uncharacterized protein n=1 Tax=Echinicola vietnamensis (strain DSM 17526 / LMG 23754 / KMM 6221) TaxID=926556 RepID=L0FY22_ECHVK|nr:hypothetical protein [Echinicola vietnamensis]AGA77651.1 hypothetical protein Echvi_1382 [Echinicola vietnamensis DSM 17526]